jgi:hypothetical protein
MPEIMKGLITTAKHESWGVRQMSVQALGKLAKNGKTVYFRTDVQKLIAPKRKWGRTMTLLRM